jgi:hypothetical protein
MQIVYAEQADRAVEESSSRDVKIPAPARPEDLAAHYDLTISHPLAEAVTYAAFESWLTQEAEELGLSCALFHDGTAPEAVRRLAAGALTIGYHLGYGALWHRPDDVYARLAEAVQDTGGRPANAPARSRAFTDKAAMHAELLRHGLGVPATVIFRPDNPDRPLTVGECRILRLADPGTGLFIKPAHGLGGRGVSYVADSGAFLSALATSRQYDRQDAYLVQREVRCPLLRCDDGMARPAYWRVLGCLGDLIPFWWAPFDRASGRPSHHRLSPDEVRRHRLQPVLDYARTLGELSGLEWFSTQLCLSEGPEVSRYQVTGPDGRDRPVVAIDYLNDQCAVDVQSRWPGAPPDDVVRHVARRFAREAWRLRQAALRPVSVSAYRLAI